MLIFYRIITRMHLYFFSADTMFSKHFELEVGGIVEWITFKYRGTTIFFI